MATFFATYPASAASGGGPAANVNVTNASLDVVVTGSALPAGASTAAKQDTGNTSLASIDGKTPALVGGAVPVSAAALPLPTGAATAAKQDTGNTSLAAIGVSAASIDGKTPALGQAAMAASVPVAIASNQSAIPVTLAAGSGGKSLSFLFRNDYSGTPVTTGAYVEITPSTPTNVTDFLIFDSSGSLLVIATGAAASEVDQFYVQPGGASAGVPLFVAAGTRLSIKAVDVDATSGQIALTALN